MQKTTFFILSIILLLGCTEDRNIENNDVVIDPTSVLIHYWNFNTITGTQTLVNPDVTLLPLSGASISYPGSGAGYMDTFTPGYDSNLQNTEDAGSGLRARNPSDTRNLVMAVPTTGYKTIVVQFATAATSSGAQTQNYSYTVDGTNYSNEGLNTTTFNSTIDPIASLVSLDFTSITGVNNNPNFKIKISFTGSNASGTSGNNRFDNVTVKGIPVSTTPLYLLHYWNFNNLATGTLTNVNADISLLSTSTATIKYTGTGAGYMDQYTPGSALNLQNSDVAGLGLRFRNPSDTRNVIITAPTTGYKNVVMKFATARSSASGASIQNYSYSLDGVNFLTTGLATTTFNPNIDPSYDVITLDFSAIIGANNNPNFVVKINFGGTEASGISGNNRIDNVTFQANHI
ncbi:MAG: hypothetical protein ACOYLT_06865 [Flavobacterium sp.]|uniref:hypothetical protein n=1 Tax=Flavobacterium sp. TaxID=239 RepID=UPI003BBA7DAE